MVTFLFTLLFLTPVIFLVALTYVQSHGHNVRWSNHTDALSPGEDAGHYWVRCGGRGGYLRLTKFQFEQAHGIAENNAKDNPF